MTKPLLPQTIEKLIQEALAIEAEEALQAGTVGFMARAMVQATLPHRSVKGNEFTRRNGNFTLTMIAPSKIGLPYGNIPRLLLAWLSTEAVKTKSREIALGNSLSDFMRQIGQPVAGNPIMRVKTHTRRLFSTRITAEYTDKDPTPDQPDRMLTTMTHYDVAESAMLFWNTQNPAQPGLWDSTVVLGQMFYDELIQCPVPIDLRALKAIKNSPLALDIYCWLTYRMGYVKRRTAIPWGLLQQQFGSDYPLTAQGKADFKRKFLFQLNKVQAVYPAANLEIEQNSLVLKPSKPHVKRLTK